MNTPSPSADHGTLTEDALSLMEATAGVAGEKVSEARNRLAAAIEYSKKALIHAKDKAIEGAKATDQAVHKHPYMAIGIAAGIGALVGFLIARKSCHHHD